MMSNLPPAMIKKSDGATLYITRDIATAMYRARTYNFVENIYAWSRTNESHFRQLKAVLKENGIRLERRYDSCRLWFGDKEPPKIVYTVKVISFCLNQPFKKLSLVRRTKLKLKILILKQRYCCSCCRWELSNLRFKTDRRNVYMTLIWKQWCP